MKKSFAKSEAVVVAAALVTLLAATGCPHSADSTTTTTPAAIQAEQNQFRGPILHNALHVLDGLEQFDKEPALEQVVDRLNQWGRSQDVEVAWKSDPMIATLPKSVQGEAWFDKLEDKTYDHHLDGEFLMEATWLRDISKQARGHDLDDLAVAQSLFDWTVRNVELIDVPSIKQAAALQQIQRRRPADVLLQGQGTAMQRAWVFMLLGRQQGLDIVMLVVPDPDRPDRPRPWLPALLHQGQLYLFDTTLGLPIPGPGGKGIATLTQAAEDESVLGSLDLDDSHHYWVKAAEAKQVTAFIEASPGYLARRMKVLESQLAGDEKVTLSASPEQIAGRLKGIAHLAPEIKLWSLPYETYALRQLDPRGNFEFQQRLSMEMSPFKVPGYHGSRSTVIKPGQRQAALDDLISQGENPDEKQVTAVTPGKGGANSRLVFVVKNEQANFEKVDIEFQDNPAVTAEHETVKFDNSNPQQPKLIFQIAAGKTTANDILHAMSADPTAALLFDARNTPDSSGEGPIVAADSTTATRVTVKRSSDIDRPVRIVFPLWAGRLLHFRGLYDGESGAKHFYMMARPGNDQFAEYVGELLGDYQEANNQPPPADFIPRFSWAVLRRKQDATYWLGLISFDEGQYEASEDYFQMVPQEVAPNIPSPWAAAAKYNLARTYEASGRTADAIKLLEADDSAQRFGNRLRARQLKQEAKGAEAPAKS